MLKYVASPQRRDWRAWNLSFRVIFTPEYELYPQAELSRIEFIGAVLNGDSFTALLLRMSGAMHICSGRRENRYRCSRPCPSDYKVNSYSRAGCRMAETPAFCFGLGRTGVGCVWSQGRTRCEPVRVLKPIA